MSAREPPHDFGKPASTSRHSLVHSRSDVVRLRLAGPRSAPAPLAVLGQAPYRGDGPIVHSDAGCLLRRQWKAAPALEGPASFHVLVDPHSRRNTCVYRKSKSERIDD